MLRRLRMVLRDVTLGLIGDRRRYKLFIEPSKHARHDALHSSSLPAHKIARAIDVREHAMARTSYLQGTYAALFRLVLQAFLVPYTCQYNEFDMVGVCISCQHECASLTLLCAVDPKFHPDYWQRVSCPCDLATILSRVDNRQYQTVGAYLTDMAMIVQVCECVCVCVCVCVKAFHCLRCTSAHEHPSAASGGRLCALTAVLGAPQAGLEASNVTYLIS